MFVRLASLTGVSQSQRQDLLLATKGIGIKRQKDIVFGFLAPRVEEPGHPFEKSNYRTYLAME